MEYSGLASSLKPSGTIDVDGARMTRDSLEGMFNFDYLRTPPKPSVVYMHGRDVKAYEVLAWTRANWDWPVERKMKSKKWWRRRNKQLWRLQQEEQRLIQEARERYDRDVLAPFMHVDARADDLVDSLRYAMLAKIGMSVLDGSKNPDGTINIRSVSLI